VVVLAGEAGSVRGAVAEIRATAPANVVETKIMICLPGKVYHVFLGNILMDEQA
jgi:hypothetical protein